MEVHRARFLRARFDDLAKMAYPVSFRVFLVSCVELGLSGFSKLRRFSKIANKKITLS